jgi:hypothetical protein
MTPSACALVGPVAAIDRCLRCCGCAPLDGNDDPNTLDCFLVEGAPLLLLLLPPLPPFFFNDDMVMIVARGETALTVRATLLCVLPR